MTTPIDLCRCPRSKSPLIAAGNQLVCTDPECRLGFPVRDGIPVMLVDQATEIPPDAWRQMIDSAGAE